jgi:hypothetical protein
MFDDELGATLDRYADQGWTNGQAWEHLSIVMTIKKANSRG